jgi:hypothetical protein
MICFGLVEGRLPVLAIMTNVDRKIDSSDTISGQRRPRVRLDDQHPDAEQRGVKVDDGIDPANAVIPSTIRS